MGTESFAAQEWLNTREQSSLFWLGVFFLWTLTKGNIRTRYVNLLRSAFKWKILIPVGVFAAYVVGVVWGLQRGGMWQPPFTKDVVIWFLFTGTVMLAGSATEAQPRQVWWDTVRSHFTVVVVLTFLISSYTFAWFIEIMLVPFVTILVMSAVVADHMGEEYADTARLLKGVEAVVGWAILAGAVVKALEAYQEFSSLASIHRFALPFILTVASVPVMYAVVVYAAYDKVWIWSGYRKQPTLTWYIRWRLFRYGGLSLSRIQQIGQVPPYQFMRVKSREDFDRLIRESLLEERDDGPMTGSGGATGRHSA